MYFHISLIPRVAYFLLPLESNQEATSGWNFTKCISEVKVNQLKVKNILVKMGISPFKSPGCYFSHVVLSLFRGKWSHGLRPSSSCQFLSCLNVFRKRLCDHSFCTWYAHLAQKVPWRFLKPAVCKYPTTVINSEIYILLPKPCPWMWHLVYGDHVRNGGDRKPETGKICSPKLALLKIPIGAAL